MVVGLVGKNYQSWIDSVQSTAGRGQADGPNVQFLPLAGGSRGF